MNHPLTTTLTRQLSPSLLRSEVDMKVAKIRPSCTPLDQISRLIGSRRAKSMRVEYYSVETKEGHDSVAKDIRDLIVSSGRTFEVEVKTPGLFSATETVLIPSVTIPSGPYKGQDLVAYVDSIADSKLKLIPVNIGPDVVDLSIGSLSAGETIIRMGRAARELDVQTTLFTAIPRKDYNFCQIFKTQIEQSQLQRLADKEVGWEMTDQEEVAVMDMRMGMEKSFLFGARSRVCLGDTADEVFFTGGIWNQTDHTYFYDHSQAPRDETANLSQAAFSGKGGTTKKVLLAGSELLKYLSRDPDVSVINSEGKETVYDIDFNVINTRYGKLYVHYSEVFDLCGKADCGIVIDPNYITKYSHIPFSTNEISFRKQGVRNTDALVLTEASCLVLRHPDVHLRIEPAKAQL